MRVVSFLIMITFLPLAAGEAQLPQQRLIEISERTTHITEPLDEQGFVDYAAYLNRVNSEGVTAENNALILYWNAVGYMPRGLTLEYREILVDELGVDVFSASGPYLIDLETFAKVLVQGKVLQEERLLLEQWDEVSEPGWIRKNHLLIDQWLRINQLALQRFTEGSNRERYYQPLIKTDEHEAMLSASSPITTSYRVAAKLLQVRAMLAISEGRRQDAKNDLLTIHRLARHCTRSFSMQEVLIGVSIDAIASEADRDLAFYGQLTGAELTDWRRELARLGPIADFSQLVNFLERISALDAAQITVKESLSEAPKRNRFGSRVWRKQQEFLFRQKVMQTLIDCNLVMKMINDDYDRLFFLARLPDYRDRTAALKRFSEEIRAQMEEFNLLVRNAPFELLNYELRSRFMGTQLLQMFVPTSAIFVDTQNRADARFATTQAGLAIRAFEADFNRLPANLSNLVPRYLEQIPLDPYTNSPLVYRTRRGEFAVYSLGKNLKDDGGRSIEDEGSDFENHDYAFRTYQWILE